MSILCTNICILKRLLQRENVWYANTALFMFLCLQNVKYEEDGIGSDIHLSD